MTERNNWLDKKYLVKIKPGDPDQFTYASAFLEVAYQANPNPEEDQVVLDAFGDVPKNIADGRKELNLSKKSKAEMLDAILLQGVDSETLEMLITLAEKFARVEGEENNKNT